MASLSSPVIRFQRMADRPRPLPAGDSACLPGTATVAIGPIGDCMEFLCHKARVYRETDPGRSSSGGAVTREFLAARNGGGVAGRLNRQAQILARLGFTAHP